jgi:hypothetical protein
MQTIAAGAWSKSTRRGRGRPIAVVVLAVVVLWLVVGLIRGPSLAAAAFAAFESPRTVSVIQTTTIPPFVVQVEATVTEPGGASYPSSQVFFIEPFTGWWVNLSQIGLAPSA